MKMLIKKLTLFLSVWIFLFATFLCNFEDTSCIFTSLGLTPLQTVKIGELLVLECVALKAWSNTEISLSDSSSIFLNNKVLTN